MAFKRAKRENLPAKILIDGPSNSGKSYGALLLAKGLAEGEKIAAACTENGRINYYAHLVDFDVEVMNKFGPDDYISLIHSAESEGYKVLIIDGITPMWKYSLSIVDQHSASQKFNAWNPVKASIQRFLAAIQASNMHIICTVRSKQSYVLQANENGKMAPVKMGLEPQFESNIEFEFDFGFSVNQSHSYSLSKVMFDDGEIPQSGILSEEIGENIRRWIEEGYDLDADFIDLLEKIKIKKEEFLCFINRNKSENKSLEIPRSVKSKCLENKEEAQKAFMEWKESLESQEGEKNESI